MMNKCTSRIGTAQIGFSLAISVGVDIDDLNEAVTVKEEVGWRLISTHLSKYSG